MTTTARRQPPPLRPADAGTRDLREHRLADGTIYAITFNRRVPRLGQVEVYSQIRIPRLDREAHTWAAATVAGRRITAQHDLGSLNDKVATRILDRHLLPQLRAQAARR
jgi:hypothetical protein